MLGGRRHDWNTFDGYWPADTPHRCPPATDGRNRPDRLVARYEETRLPVYCSVIGAAQPAGLHCASASSSPMRGSRYWRTTSLRGASTPMPKN